MKRFMIVFAFILSAALQVSAQDFYKEDCSVVETAAYDESYQNRSGEGGTVAFPSSSVKLYPNMTYRQLQHIYDYSTYIPHFMDRYSPGWIGFASFLIPGLGECICEEWGRGLVKFGSNVVLATTASIFTMKSYRDVNWRLDIAVAVICYAAVFGIDIWSIVDAVRIARVKNMYTRDLMNQYSIDVDLFPSVNYVQIGNKVQPTAGLTLALRF